jgi:hypothetical protein
MADIMVVEKNHSTKLDIRIYHGMNMIQEKGERPIDNPE